MAKATKTAANYRAGTSTSRCGLCTMFRKPSSCTAVKGHISASALCDYFERATRTPKTRADRLYGGTHG